MYHFQRMSTFVESTDLLIFFAFVSGVPLEECPTRPSGNVDCSGGYLERVPHLVKVCTSIVEERGLEIVGIYRHGQ